MTWFSSPVGGLSLRKAGLSAAWLVLAIVSTALGLLTIHRSLSGLASTTLVLVAVAAAAATVIGLGILVLWAIRDAIALSRVARDGGGRAGAEVRLLRSELSDVRGVAADLRSVADGLVGRVDDLVGRHADLVGRVDDLVGRVDDLVGRLDGLPASFSRTHEGLDDVTSRVGALADRLDVLAAGLEQAALDDTRATLDLASGLADLRDRLDVDHASTSTGSPNRDIPERP